MFEDCFISLVAFYLSTHTVNCDSCEGEKMFLTVVSDTENISHNEDKDKQTIN